MAPAHALLSSAYQSHAGRLPGHAAPAVDAARSPVGPPVAANTAPLTLGRLDSRRALESASRRRSVAAQLPHPPHSATARTAARDPRPTPTRQWFDPLQAHAASHRALED